VDANGALRYRLRLIGTELIPRPYEQTADIGDVYRFQISVRYLFR
jgi:hypothetical protein